MRKMGDSGSQTLENCPLARRAWSLYQDIHRQCDLMARLSGPGHGAGRESQARMQPAQTGAMFTGRVSAHRAGGRQGQAA